MSFRDFWMKLFGKKPSTIQLKWGVSVLNPDGGTQCLPVDGSGGSASSTDWSLGLQPVGTPGVMVKASKLIVSASNAPGYMNVQVQRYINGVPVGGWLPNATLTGGATQATVELGDVLVEGDASFQAQVGLSPNANSVSVNDVKVTFVLVK